ncbi:MAG: single-stranded DNA-binding protein [Verrucomicrobiae bacterium]|nr:single-stranded DNA-binding protein [Verrucomicrobiae bacterium]
MASFNKVILLGNLTRDPELRFTPKGQAVARIGLAVNRSYKTESGESREEVTFIDVDAWGKQAELIGQYLRKGSPLFVEGRLKLDQWDDKNTGQKVSKLRVVMEGFQFVGGPRSGEGGGGPTGGSMGGPMGGSMGGSMGSGASSASPPPRAQRSAPAPSDGGDGPQGEVDDVPF